MADGIRYHAGGIQGLLVLHEEHGEAIDRDLMVAGLRWSQAGTDVLTWHDLLVFVRHSPPGSAIYRALSPGGAGWAPTDYLLADLFDAVQALTYITAHKGTGRTGRRPKPYPRPGVKNGDRTTQVFKTKPMTIPQMREWLGWDKPAKE